MEESKKAVRHYYDAYGRNTTCVTCSKRGGGYIKRRMPVLGKDESLAWRILKCSYKGKDFCKCTLPPPVLLKYLVCQNIVEGEPCGVIRKGVVGGRYMCPNKESKCGNKNHSDWALSLVGPSKN